jgi:hypothetical protein
MQFSIEPDGSITNIKAYKNNTGCDQFSSQRKSCIKRVFYHPTSFNDYFIINT